MMVTILIPFSLLFLFCRVTAIEYLADPSFENPVSPNWESYGSGFSVSTTSWRSGTKSIYASATTTSEVYGAYKCAYTNQNSVGAIRISGWSMSNTPVSLPSDGNYAIYADLVYTDSTNHWAVTIPFAAGTAHDWQYQCDTLVVDKKIASITLYALFRFHTGTVYFDDFSIADYTLWDVITTRDNPLKILLPLYIHPGCDWDIVQASASAVPITVIANVFNGPGLVQDPVYAYYINKFIRGDPAIPVLGYVATSYGNRDKELVKADILKWAQFYGVSGIFFDETSMSMDLLPYFSELSAFVKTNLGYSAQVFFNPGYSVPENYTFYSDSITTFENDFGTFNVPVSAGPMPVGWPRAPCFSSYSSTWKYKSSALIFDVEYSRMHDLVDKVISKGYGYVYITDKTLPKPYSALPSYWNSLVAYIRRKNA